MSSPRLSIIPAGAVTDRSLEPRDLQVLALLGRHIDRAGWCVRSQVRMAREIYTSRSSVQRSLDRLYEAGWVEKKQRGGLPSDPSDAQPSVSHAYRVRLDRDDFIWNVLTAETPENAEENQPENDAESHAESALQEADCPPVGTPSQGGKSASEIPQNNPQGAQPYVGTPAQQDGHPGAQPRAGTGAQPYAGTNNASSERPHIEQQRRAREGDGDRTVKFLRLFEALWPTAAVDDRHRVAYAAEALSAGRAKSRPRRGVTPFLDNLKRLGRKTFPAGWRYLEQKSWQLQPVEPSPPAENGLYPEGSIEARAIAAVYAIAGQTDFVARVMKSRQHGGIYYRGTVTPQLLALGNVPPEADWPELTHQQAGAWNGLLREFVIKEIWNRLREGKKAPWPWPPRKDGTLSTTGPPDTLMTDQDVKDLDQLGKMTG